MNFPANIKRPSAFVPIAMSMTALGTVLLHIALFGITREADEGAAAHIWQLLMAGQIPFVAFYAFVTLISGDKEVIGLVWQLAIILGAAAVFSFFMWRSLRRR